MTTSPFQVRSERLLGIGTFAIVISILASIGGCGKHPPVPKSVEAIERIPADTKSLRLAYLPVEQYPALRRLTNVVDANLVSAGGPGGDDEKLKALANLPWYRLKNVALQNCSLVTDTGVLAIVHLPSITSLGLERTSVTDAGLKILAQRTQLEAVNVQGCKNVTLDGVRALAKSTTMRSIGFSSSIADEADIVRLVQSATNITWYIEDDPAGKLDRDRLASLANVPRARVLISHGGVYQ